MSFQYNDYQKKVQNDPVPVSSQEGKIPNDIFPEEKTIAQKMQIITGGLSLGRYNPMNTEDSPQIRVNELRADILSVVKDKGLEGKLTEGQLKLLKPGKDSYVDRVSGAYARSKLGVARDDQIELDIHRNEVNLANNKARNAYNVYNKILDQLMK